MFVVHMRFAPGKFDEAKVAELRPSHDAWIDRGFADGVFLLAGSRKPGPGGLLLAHNTTEEDLRARLDADPFIVASLMAPEIVEFQPGRADDRVKFLIG